MSCQSRFQVSGIAPMPRRKRPSANSASVVAPQAVVTGVRVQLMAHEISSTRDVRAANAPSCPNASA